MTESFPSAEDPRSRRYTGRASERRQQRNARVWCGLGLVAAAGLAVLALATARTPTTTQAPASPLVADVETGGGVGTAGLAPSIQPPPTETAVSTAGTASAVSAAA